MSEIFDLDAARARRVEQSGEPLRFTWQGREFVVPPMLEWSLEVPELMAEGRAGDGLRKLLGPDQADAFFAGDPTVGDVESLAEWLGRTALGSAGN